MVRLEDKEAEIKKENSRLHERYNDLLRNHMEVVERSKIASNSDVEMGSVGSGYPIGRHHHHHHHHVLIGKSRDNTDKPSNFAKRGDEEFYEENDVPTSGEET